LRGRPAGTVTGLVAPLTELVQLLVSSNDSCNTQPGAAGVQDNCAKPGAPRKIVTVGAPGLATTSGKAQKLPVTANAPLVNGPPASGWPRVPLRACLKKKNAQNP